MARDVFWYNAIVSNMKLKSQSWMLLVGLSLIVAFAAGIRQGLSVEKENGRRQNEILKLTPSPTPSFGYRVVQDERCGVSYLRPEYITSDSSIISITCDNTDGTRSADLTKEGYVETPVYKDGYLSQSVWIKTTENLLNLVNRSIQIDTP